MTLRHSPRGIKPQKRKEGVVLARVISFQVPPLRLEEIENAYRSTLLPEMEAHRGFSGVFLLRHEDTSEILELTLWEDEAAKLESERAS